MSHDAHITHNDLTLPMGHFTLPNVMSNKFYLIKMEKIFDNHGQTYCYSFITVCKQYNYLKKFFLTFKNIL